MNILIIEDEKDLAKVLVNIMKKENYKAECVYDGDDGVDYALSGIYDIIILDVMLPRKSGFEVLQEVRKQGLKTPILMLTAKSEIEDKVAGLDYGADDYLTKPFNTSELLARVRALSRRKEDYVVTELKLGNIILNKDTHEISTSKSTIKLGIKEFEILELLMENKGRIITKEQFNEKIWGFDSEAEYNTIEVYVSFLRKKLAAACADVEIKTKRGVGYYL
ncbi:MAG: response regulator transcription factor [Clostridiales bacterium]|jgi:DNA-binding response OmpR family regulator|nr:response regulator transcription factor [Clostridiales bacterium]